MKEKRVVITYFMPPEASINGDGVGTSYILHYKDPAALMDYLNLQQKMLDLIPEENHGFIITPVLDEEQCYKYVNKYLGDEWDD